MNFYESIDLFSSWAAISMKYLVYHTEKKNFVRGQIIYKQNDVAENFYIIRSGEFQMIYKIPIKEEIENTKDHFNKHTRALANLEVFLIISEKKFISFQYLEKEAFLEKMSC